MKILTLIYSLMFFAISSMPALAGCLPGDPGCVPSNPIPEPGALALLAIGVAAVVLVKSRGRNKK